MSVSRTCGQRLNINEDVKQPSEYDHRYLDFIREGSLAQYSTRLCQLFPVDIAMAICRLMYSHISRDDFDPVFQHYSE